MLSKISNPAIRAVSLERAKAHLRYDQADEDDLIGVYLDACIEEAAKYTQRAINQQGYSQTFTCWPNCSGNCLELDTAPIVAVFNVAYADVDNVLQAVSEYDWTFRRTAKGGVVEFGTEFVFPTLWPQGRPVSIEFEAGYDPDDGSSGIEDPELKMPPAIEAAILLGVGHLFANREAVQSGKVPMVLPRGAEMLLDRFKIYR